MILRQNEYGELYNKLAYLINRKDPKAYEVAAKAMILSKILKLEGLYYMLYPFVNVNRDKVPKYLLGGDSRDRTEFFWKILYIKYCGDGKMDIGDEARLWWLRNFESVKPDVKLFLKLYEGRLDGVSYRDLLKLIGV